MGIHPDDATMFEISDLLPDAIYEFSVQSHTSSSSDALFSKVLRVRTKALDDFDLTRDGREFHSAYKKNYHHHRREGAEGGGVGRAAGKTSLQDQLETGDFEIRDEILPPLRRG